LAATAFAADFMPPEIAALHAKAENGNAIAQYNLGLAYATGSGVAIDKVEAFVWLTLASEQGSTGKDLT
jgi:TPR repeat protein